MRQAIGKHWPTFTVSHVTTAIKNNTPILSENLVFNKYCVPHEHHHYTIRVRVVFSSTHIGVFVRPQPGDAPSALRWPIDGSRLFISVLSHSPPLKDRVFAFTHETAKQFLAKHSPPVANNTGGWGHAEMISISELDRFAVDDIIVIQIRFEDS